MPKLINISSQYELLQMLDVVLSHDEASHGGHAGGGDGGGGDGGGGGEGGGGEGEA